MASGGKMIVDALKVFVETGKPSFVSRMIGIVNFLTGPLAPKKCRSEHWPLEKKIN
jgi:hypothetical protein